MGGEITLLPTHLHPQYSTYKYRTRGTNSEAGWWPCPAHTQLVVLSPGRTPRSIIQPAFSHSSEHLAIFVSFFLSSSQTRTLARIHSPPGRPINP